MKKLFTFLSRANNNSVGLTFNHLRVSSLYSMLTLVTILLIVPQGMKAATITTPYNFNFSSSDNKTITWSTESESGCTFFETVGGSTNYTRFATNGTNWNLTTKAGLYNNASGGRDFLVSKLYNGDVVTFNVSTNASYGTDVVLVSTNATKSDNTFTMTAKRLVGSNHSKELLYYEHYRAARRKRSMGL